MVVYGPASPLNGCGTPSLSGWPDSIRDMSASGPFGVMVFGVWQSWQPPPMTSILPRSICDCAVAGAAAGAGPLGRRRLH